MLLIKSSIFFFDQGKVIRKLFPALVVRSRGLRVSKELYSPQEDPRRMLV